MNFLSNFALILSNAPTNMPAPFGFENWLTFWLVCVISTLNAIAMCFAGYKFLQIVQLSNYRLKGCFAWLRDTKGKFWAHLLMLSFLSSCALLVTNVLLEQFFVYKIMSYIGLLFYATYLIVFILNIYSTPQKTPLKYTYRINRLVGVLFVVVWFSTFFILNLSILHVPYFQYGAVGLTPAFLPIFILIAYLITWPFEQWNNTRFLVKAKNRLKKEFPKLTVIGITGSYGKTSVKNILATLLSEKYSVCTTPHSYNTPLGLSKTILSLLKPENEIFIAEMGAKHKGDIKFLCDLVNPSIGVITGIGNQHLSTFGSLAVLQNTKFELIESLKNGGRAFFNGDNDGAMELFEKAKCKKDFSALSKPSAMAYAKNISVSSKGSEFDLCISNGKSIHCETSLLGKHNISNILLCVSIAISFGVSLKQIASAISKLTPTAHRLAIVPSGNSLIVIDDAYNSSVQGYLAALDVLSMFSGKKIVITPGLIELGKDEFNANFEFGMKMAKVCDKVIIDGIENYDAISAGLEFGGFSKDNILRAGSLSQAVDVLGTISSPGDAVLFENDLPDNHA